MEAAMEKFKEMLMNSRSDNGKIDFKVDLTSLVEQEERRANIMFDPIAWLKMRNIVSMQSEECAWHGTVERNGLNFRITDVFMYPQKVASTTVESTDDYDQWIINLDADIINTMRFQGHSHVNMAASPSGVDTNNWDDWLQGLGDDDFYIFTIQNKKGEAYWILYDLASNTIFEKDDIDVGIECPDWASLADWTKGQVEQYVEKKSYTIATTSQTADTKAYGKTTNTGYSGYGFDGYRKGTNGFYYPEYDRKTYPVNASYAEQQKYMAKQQNGKGKTGKGRGKRL